MTADNNAGYFARHYGGMVAIARQLMRKDVKIYFVGLGYEDGPVIINQMLQWIDDDIQANDKVYGEDYVHLGYVAGFESAYASFCRNVKASISQDFYGNPIEDLPMMEDFNSAEDVDFWVQVGNPLFMPAIRQFAIAFDKGDKLVAIGFEGNLAQFKPQMDAGNLLSGIEGSKDGVVYENLVNAPFVAAAQYNGGNLLMIMAVFAMILSNVFYQLGKPEEEE
jgi:hypothetical protein